MELAQEGTKRSPFDDLSRDELVTKCKGLLVIAQKAKLAKSELQNEVESFKLQLEKSETEKKASQENVRTLQELVDSLTEQKLNFITEIDTAQGKLKILNNNCNTYQEEITKYKADIVSKDKIILDITQKLTEFDTEVTSLKRQNGRLLEENEQLLNQLSELEARTEEFNRIGLQQREQLQILEDQFGKDADYKEKIEELNHKIKELENTVQSNETAMGYSSGIEYESKIKEIFGLYESEKIKNEKANVKLRSYKDKILKCAACITQLKNSRFILSKTVKEYSESISKWQNDIMKACQMLNNQINEINNLNNENSSLKDKLDLLEKQLNESLQANNISEEFEFKTFDLLKENETLKSEISSIRLQIKDYVNNYATLKDEHTAITSSYQDLRNNRLAVMDENKLLKDQCNELTQKINILSNENSKLIDNMKELEINNKELISSQTMSIQNQDIVEKLNLQIKALESEKAILVKEKFNARDNLSELESQNKMLTIDLEESKLEIQKLKLSLENTIQEKELFEQNYKKEKEGEINNLMCKIMSTQEQYDLIKKQYDDLQDLNALLREEVETLKLSLEQPKDDTENLSDLNVSLQADIVKLETKLSAYKQENASLLIDIKEFRTKAKEFDSLVTECEDAKSKLSAYKTENAELLNEMKEINQVLKERGESISKLQKAVVEMENLIETLEKDRDNINQEKDELHKKVETLQSELRNAEDKTAKNSKVSEQIVIERDIVRKALTEKDAMIESLKEEIEKLKQQQTGSAELPNEDMSTSTISKAEEHSRMKDLDETFEDKYTKLRIFALKLKKKLNETMKQLQNAENDKAKLEKMLSENGTGDKKVPIVHEECITKSDNDNKDLQKLEISDLQAKVKSLTSSLQTSEQMSSELEAVKAELSAKTQQLAAEIESHKATKDNLEKARRDVKKKNVLSLEMEDYERSMKELTTKMEETKKKMVQMESTIDTQEGTINAMKTQIKLLEEQIKTEEAQIRSVKEELQNAIDEGKEKDNVIQVKNGIISKLEQDLEDEKRKNEEADLEMTSMLSEKEKIIMNLGEVKTELNNKLKKLEFKCAELNEQLRITNIELADLKTEYTSYKVRAQAVLRQNQTVDHSQEERMKEDAAALQAQIVALTTKLENAQEQCQEQTVEAETARRRAAEATSEAARAQQRTTRLQADLTRLAQQLESERTQHKLQVSTLTQCYKTQMSELEGKLQKEIEALRKQLSAAQELKGKSGNVIEPDHSQYMLPVIPKEDSDGELDINVSLIPREDGEGSESAPSPPLSKPYLSSSGGGRSPVPLERLLEEGVPDDEALDTSSLALTSEQEIADLRRKLLAQQQRVKHITMLLSESERECARMSQLSELLKSELRRVRGTSQNAHNTEYMKNVTLKFLTLPPGDERSRLVPVLQKILTLSQDEMQKIQAIAKGLDPNPSKGWGSYLPWPGGK